MAFAAVGALFGAMGAGTAVSAGMVLSAVAEVGTAMTVVGAVTGSKDLMKVGGVMGAVGGIGGMVAGGMSAAGGAAGSAAAGETSGLASSPSAAATGVDAADIGAAPGMLPQTTGDLAGATNMGSDVYSTGADAAGLGNPGIIGSALDSGASDLSAAAGGLDPSTGVTDPSAITSTDLSSSPVASVTAGGTTPSTTPGMIAAPPVQPPGMTGTSSVQNAMVPSSNPQDSQSFMQRMMGFLQDPKNRTMLQMGEKLAGGALQGMQQSDQFQQKMDLENRRLAQTSYGSQVAGNAPRRGIVAGAR